MIVKMTKFSWILLSADKDSFIGNLSELGVVDICRSNKPIDDHSEELFSKIECTKQEIKRIQKGESEHLSSMLAQMSQLKDKAELLQAWGEFDPEQISALENQGIKLFFYYCPEKKFIPDWAQQWALQEISRKDGKVYFVIAGSNQGFALNAIQTPDTTWACVNKEIEALQLKIDTCKESLEKEKDCIPALQEHIRQTMQELDSYLASCTSESVAEDTLVVYEGFAPVEEKERLCTEFDRMGLLYFCDQACVEDNPPIAFANNKFVKLFEPLTDMYGRPSYDGFDPSPFISIFFLLFFAICMGDMGYGLVLMIAGLLLKKVPSFKSLSPLVTILGAGTIAVGFFFHTFFSVDLLKLDWIPQGVKSVMLPSSIAGYDGTMVLALVIGVLHLCLAMIVKTVNETRNKGFIESLGTWGWTLLIVGGVVVAATALAGVIDAKLTKIILIALGAVCAIGIYPLNNIHRNPLVNIGSGLWETYNMATGILGDVLSYLRLYALGLAGAMLGFAFNDLAALALGDGGARWIAFILIVIVGHTLNLAMAALGAFVHPLRLNFLEFFKNSGYEATGKKYNPIKKQ